MSKVDTSTEKVTQMIRAWSTTMPGDGAAVWGSDAVALLQALVEERDEALERIDNAHQQACDTQPSWGWRFSRIMGALGLDSGDPEDIDKDIMRSCAAVSEQDALKAAADAERRLAQMIVDYNRLKNALNTPQHEDFAAGVVNEAQHQRERWGADHDAQKSHEDWFWLVGYLAGKALHAANNRNIEKAQHHAITTAAALAHWHAALTENLTEDVKT